MCSLPLLAGSGHVPFVVVSWNTVVCSRRFRFGTPLVVPADFRGGTLLVDPLECEEEQCVRLRQLEAVQSKSRWHHRLLAGA